MKKILIILLFSIAICNSVFAESYYFKKCSLNKTVSADYLIDLENKIINVVFKSADGKIQKVKDGIESIEKDKIISKKIKSAKSEDSYFIYYLDTKTQSVIKQNYKHNKIGDIDFVKPDGPKIINNCAEVKADWEQVKINKIKKKEMEKKIKKKKEEEEKRNKIKLENEKKRKEQENKYKVSVIGEKWIKLSKYNYESVEKNKLEEKFNINALEICKSNNLNNFKVLQKRIEIVETDETPAFGTETVIKIGINGLIECK